MSEIPDIFAEIDEEMEADKVAKHWQTHRGWILGALVIFFAGLFGYVGWREYREKHDLMAAEQYMIALEMQEKGRYDESNKAVAEIYSQFANHGYAQLVVFIEAKSLVAAGKPEEAIASLVKLGNNGQALAPLRAMAWLQAAYLASPQPEKAEGYLANISADSAFQAPAMELKGLFALARGDRQGGLSLLREALAKRPPPTLRERLELVIKRLSPESSGPAVEP